MSEECDVKEVCKEGENSESYFAVTQPIAIADSENLADETCSQDTYCSTNSQSIEEKMETEDDLKPEITSSHKGNNIDIIVDTVDKFKSEKMDTTMEVEITEECSTDDSHVVNVSSDIDRGIGSNVQNESYLFYISDTDKSCSLIEEKPIIKSSPKTSPEIKTDSPENKLSIDKGKSPELFSEVIGTVEASDTSAVEMSILTIPDTSGDTSFLESPKVKIEKRKADRPSKDETPSKKARPSCMIIYEGTPTMTVSTIDMTKKSSEMTILLDDTQDDFSLRLDSQSDSPTNGKHSSGESWKSHKDVPSKNVSPTDKQYHSDKESDLSWHSHKENSKEDYALLKGKYDALLKKYLELNEKVTASISNDESTLVSNGNSPETNSSKESLLTFTEKRFMCGVVQFTVNEATNQVITAEVKQLSLLEHTGKDKSHKSPSSGSLADRSFSSGTSGDSRVSMFSLPVNRQSVSSSSSSTSVLSSASAYRPGMNNWDGPFLVPTAPVLKYMKDPTYPPLSGSGFPFLPMENLEEFLLNFNLLNRGSELNTATLEDKTNKIKPMKTIKETDRDDKIKAAKETEVKEKEVDVKSDVVESVTPQRKGRRRTKPKTSATKPNVVEDTLTVPEGKPVFAKWSDSQYYPGWVNQDLSCAKVTVNFCDGNVSVLSSVKVIPATWLKPGTVVLVLKLGKSEYVPALVMNVEPGGKEGPTFTIDSNEYNSRTVTFAQIAITESKVAELKEEAIATGRMGGLHLVSLDNVLNHPRTRTPRTPTTPVRTPAKTPRTPKSTSRKKEPQPSTSHGKTSSIANIQDPAVDTDGSTSSVATDTRVQEFMTLDPECSPQEFPETSRRKTSQLRVKSTVQKSKRVLDEEYDMDKKHGPYPAEGSKIFAGYNFLITYTKFKKSLKSGTNNYTCPTSDDEGTSTSDENFNVKSFNKQRLRAQIKKGGGKLYINLQQVPVDEYDRTYLITDTPSRTPLYLQCLVHGITIYNHQLIIDCCINNRPIAEELKTSFWRLPAGWLLEKKEYKKQGNNLQPFKKSKLNILLVLNQNKKDIQFWKKLLVAAGAKVYVQSGKVSESHLNQTSVVVTDTDCNEDIVEEAAKQKVPLVSLVWVEQCIIDGIQRPFKGHPDYNYNHIRKPESPEF